MKELALQWLNTSGALILDTETTGLGSQAEAVQLSIIDMNGSVIFNHLLRPFKATIEPGAAAVHNITNDMVAGLPTLVDPPYMDILESLRGRQIIAYNAAFDRRMMEQTAEASGSAGVQAVVSSWTWACAMDAYARHWGEWSRYHRSYKWQKLTAACYQQGVTIKNAHDALGDVFMTLALLKKVAEVE